MSYKYTKEHTKLLDIFIIPEKKECIPIFIYLNLVFLKRKDIYYASF